MTVLYTTKWSLSSNVCPSLKACTKRYSLEYTFYNMKLFQANAIKIYDEVSHNLENVHVTKLEHSGVQTIYHL